MKKYRTKNKTYSIKFLMNKRDLRASGLSLLPLALRPGLLLVDRRNDATKRSDGIKINAMLRSLAFLLVLLTMSFIIQNSYTNSAAAASLTLTIPNSISLDISPENGTTFKKSDSSTLSVKTDVSYGYTLSIKTKDAVNSNNLINGSAKLTSISSAMSENNFSSSAGNNTWGYLPSKLAGIDNSNFQPGPTSEPTVLDTTSSSTDGTNYDFTLAAKVDNTIPTGNYTNTFVLTAISNEPPVTYMQDWNGCDELGDGDTVELQDIRDKKMYTVAKLKDGKCWMTKNLEIENYNLTPADSDVEADFQIPASIDKPNASGSYSSKELHIDSTYGGYYTWYTATAGEGTYSKSSGDTSHSICPKGWRLPTIDEFYTLISEQGGNNLTNSPANFMLGGNYYNGSAYYQGSHGYYWSSTANGGSDAYYLYVGISNAYVSYEYPGTIDLNVVDGYSVRCVSRSTDPLAMQDVATWGPNLQEGETVEAVDVRDNNIYTVSKLKDGKIWMTSNLRLGDSNLINRTLTSDTSDVKSNYELPDNDISKLYLTGCGSADSSKALYVDANGNGYYNARVVTSDDSSNQYSICPKGWRPPTKTEFTNMATQYGNNVLTLQSSPVNLGLNGLVDNKILQNINTQGYYWTFTRTGCGDYYLCNISSNKLEFGVSYTVNGMGIDIDGANLRCIMRQPGEKYNDDETRSGICAECKAK